MLLETLTLKDYLTACEALSHCTAKTLPYVLRLLGQVGFDLEIPPEELEGKAPWVENFAKKRTDEERLADRIATITTVFDQVSEDGIAPLADVARTLGKCEKTTKEHLKEAGVFVIRSGIVVKRQPEE